MYSGARNWGFYSSPKKAGGKNGGTVFGEMVFEGPVFRGIHIYLLFVILNYIYNF